MKKTLIIGSTVVDVIVRIPHLPVTQEDINVISQHQALGGCAYNVSNMLYLEEANYILCSPVGTGIYAEFVERELTKKNIEPFVHLDIPNGCCYCLVEETGERTFLSHHGAEYLFDRKWMNKIDPTTVDKVYICGIELEETTSNEIVAYLEENPSFEVFFAPGPRIHHIKKDYLERIFSLHPIVHMNEVEALEFTHCTDIETAARHLYSITNNSIIITLGEKGTLITEKGQLTYVQSVKAHVVDTIGAGDSHAGSILANLQKGLSLENAVRRANLFASAVVSVPGATLTAEQYKKIDSLEKN